MQRWSGGGWGIFSQCSPYFLVFGSYECTTYSENLGWYNNLSVGNFSDSQCSRTLIFPPNRRRWALLRVRAGKSESTEPAHLQEITNCTKNINHGSLAPTILESLSDKPFCPRLLGDFGGKVAELFPDTVLQAVGTLCPSIAVCCERIVLSNPQSSSGSAVHCCLPCGDEEMWSRGWRGGWRLTREQDVYRIEVFPLWHAGHGL